MELATVGTKYQIVIPKLIRKGMPGIKPGSKVMVKKMDDDTITIKLGDTHRWVDELYGAMADPWQGIDPIKELKKNRIEWEERLKRLEKEFKYK